MPTESDFGDEESPSDREPALLFPFRPSHDQEVKINRK